MEDDTGTVIQGNQKRQTDSDNGKYPTGKQVE